MRTFPTSRPVPVLLCLVLTLALLPGPTSRTTAAAPLPAPPAWDWPLAEKPVVVHAFDPPAKPWLSGHRGVDLAAGQGIAVVAPTSGVVGFAGVVVNRQVLTIVEPGGLRLSFEPVNSTLRAGDPVARGQTVGVVDGPTHCDGSAVASCLHWGVRRGEEYLDPLQFIMDLRPSVLLPLMQPPRPNAACRPPPGRVKRSRRCP